MSEKPKTRMGPAPIEGEFLTEQRMIRFTPALTRHIEAARGKRSFPAWVRWAARRALGLPESKLDAGTDQGDDDSRQDPSAPTAV
jgi:hypothetical protein